jgi:TolB-like protein
MNGTAPATKPDKAASTGADKLLGVGQSPKDHPVARIHLFGPMRATTCFGDDILPDGKKARAILAYLCMAAGAPVSRARLVALLWDRMPAAAALTNLRRTQCELSSAFGVFEQELISFRRDHVKLSAGACWVDALATLAMDPKAMTSPQDGLSALCAGELLSGLDGVSASFDRWLLAERDRIAKQLQSLSNSAPKPTAPKANALREPAGQHPWTAAASGRNRLRVGVLPLTADSAQGQHNLAVPLSQQITAELARSRWFDVIAAISPGCGAASHFVNEHQIRRMNLDYLVDWSVSGHGANAQMDIRLLELAEPARPAWSERFDVGRGELHRLSKIVTTRIVRCIDPIIPLIEGKHRRQDHYGATGLLLAAMPLMFSMERGKYEEAGRLIGRALDVDPDNSVVAAWAAHWHLFYGGQRWARDIVQTHAATKKHGLKAIKLDPENAEALGIYGHICSMIDKDFDSARRSFDRSLRLNPSLPIVWAFSALTCCYAGEPESALPQLDRYRELAPFDAYFSPYENAFAIAYTFKGDYERATLVGRRLVDVSPEYVAAYKPLIASLGHLGRRDEARPYVERLLRLEPSFTVENFAEVYPIKKASDRKRYMEGLRLAGIRER